MATKVTIKQLEDAHAKTSGAKTPLTMAAVEIDTALKALMKDGSYSTYLHLKRASGHATKASKAIARVIEKLDRMSVRVAPQRKKG